MYIRTQLVKEFMAEMTKERRIYNRDDVFDAVAIKMESVYILSENPDTKELYSYENNVSALNDAISKQMSKMKLDNKKKNQGQLLLGHDLEGFEYIQHYYHVDLLDGPHCVPVEKLDENMLADVIHRAEAQRNGYNQFISEHKELFKILFKKNCPDAIKRNNSNN